MNNTKRNYFDMEFTNLHQHTTLISLGIVSDDGAEFYAEFTDYDQAQLNDWLREHVMANLYLSKPFERTSNATSVKGDTKFILGHLQEWIDDQGKVEIWSDCLAYDWMLFCELFGGALSIPKSIYYIPFDLCTLFKIKGIDPDEKREEFAEMTGSKHNALHDARVIKACVEKLI